jgi:hypothetical protein
MRGRNRGYNRKPENDSGKINIENRTIKRKTKKQKRAERKDI